MANKHGRASINEQFPVGKIQWVVWPQSHLVNEAKQKRPLFQLKATRIGEKTVKIPHRPVLL